MAKKIASIKQRVSAKPYVGKEVVKQNKKVKELQSKLDKPVKQKTTENVKIKKK